MKSVRHLSPNSVSGACGYRSRRRRQRRHALEALEVRHLLTAGAPAEAPLMTPAEALTQPAVMMNYIHDMSPMTSSTTPSGLTPQQIRDYYHFSDILFGDGTIVGDGAGQTIAIIIAFDSPNIQSDLHAFSQQFGLPDPPSFRRVTQTGGTSGYPAQDAGWTLEACLDVEWAHALAPAASILLVEANSTSTLDLISGAANYARSQPGVSVVSMSFGAGEFSGETSYDSTFTTPSGHNGVTFLAATGDGGNPGTYPAFSPNVVGVGGTTLGLSGSNITSETGWSGSGGGISTIESKPSYQNSVVTPSTTWRTIPDVSFDADLSSGVAVYDSNYGATPWIQVGGTSFSSPAWAGLIAVANQGRFLAGLSTLDGRNGMLPELYSMPASAYRDITSGSNGPGSDAGVGYDLVTGRGSPFADLVTSQIIGSSSISGKVFNDANGDGSSTGDSGLAGWTVYEDLDNDGTLDSTSSPVTFTSTDVPKTIPSIGTASSTISLSGLTSNILDVNVVNVDISHNRVGDLVLTLISPHGGSVTLASHVGGTGDNFSNTTFDDTNGKSIVQATAPFTGTFVPASALAKLIGTDPNGVWTLQVQDTVAGTGGTLTGWSLQLTTGDPQTTTDVNGNYQFTNLAAGTHRIREVLQSPYAQTTPPGGVYTVSLAADTDVTGRDFGDHLPQSTAPTGVDLLAASDTGSSSSDNITKLNNASGATTLQFDVTGTISGATVTLYDGTTVIGSAIASGTTTTVTTNGSAVLSPGAHTITARQTDPRQAESPNSTGLSIQVDTSPPVPTIDAVVPDPRTTPVTQMTITFNEPVSGLDVGDLTLTQDGGPNLLSGAQNVSSGDNITWTLSNLAGITATPGHYQLALVAAGSGITDTAGNADTASATGTFTVNGATIANRQLFYKDSTKWDVTNANLPGFSDDNAIAPDKTAYLPGSGTTTFSSVSSYSLGINGLMIDVAGVHGPITAGDFIFKVGNNNSPSTWASATPPATVTIRAGAGDGGSDRVEIMWTAGAIFNTWLEVIVRGDDTLGGSNANTGLAASDVFFFGSAPGDSGAGDTSAFSVTSADEISARNDPHGLGDPATISNVNDFNRNGLVDSTDQIIARNNVTTLGNQLRFLVVGAGGPFAPASLPQSSFAASNLTAAETQSAAIPDLAGALALAESPLATLDAGEPVLATASIGAINSPPRASAASLIQSFSLAAGTSAPSTASLAVTGPVRPTTNGAAERDHREPAAALDVTTSARHESIYLDDWSGAASDVIDEQLLDLLTIGRSHLGWRGRRH